jgi:hypothetical protein
MSNEGIYGAVACACLCTPPGAYVSSLRKFIRPNRDDVIRWYIKIVMVVLWFASVDISEFIVEAVDIENGVVRWLIRLLSIGIPLAVFVMVSKPAASALETGE